MGVAWSLAQEGVRLGGFELSLAGNVPLGAGLSSSASIEVATALALARASRVTMPLKTIALACQRAENAFCRRAAAASWTSSLPAPVKRTMPWFWIADRCNIACCLSLTHVRLVICNSMVKHEHAGGQYNTRREEVEEGTRILHRRWPSIETLRDATEAQLMDCRQQMPDNIFRRCRHIITENKRVELAALALEHGDLPAFGALMAEAHRSIRDDFEVSCIELDTLVAIASGIPGCYGARMTGGGFGGCTVNFVEEGQAEQFRETIHAAYRAATGIDADIYLCRASAGAARTRLTARLTTLLCNTSRFLTFAARPAIRRIQMHRNATKKYQNHGNLDSCMSKSALMNVQLSCHRYTTEVILQEYTYQSNPGGLYMISQCMNPACGKELHYLRNGRVIRTTHRHGGQIQSGTFLALRRYATWTLTSFSQKTVMFRLRGGPVSSQAPNLRSTFYLSPRISAL